LVLLGLVLVLFVIARKSSGGRGPGHNRPASNDYVSLERVSRDLFEHLGCDRVAAPVAVDSPAAAALVRTGKRWFGDNKVLHRRQSRDGRRIR